MDRFARKLQRAYWLLGAVGSFVTACMLASILSDVASVVGGLILASVVLFMVGGGLSVIIYTAPPFPREPAYDLRPRQKKLE